MQVFTNNYLQKKQKYNNIVTAMTENTMKAMPRRDTLHKVCCYILQRLRSIFMKNCIPFVQI